MLPAPASSYPVRLLCVVCLRCWDWAAACSAVLSLPPAFPPDLFFLLSVSGVLSSSQHVLWSMVKVPPVLSGCRGQFCGRDLCNTGCSISSHSLGGVQWITEYLEELG